MNTKTKILELENKITCQMVAINTLRADLEHQKRETQSMRQKWSDTTERANKEQGRADSAEAALLRAHKALVTAVERLGAR